MSDTVDVSLIGGPAHGTVVTVFAPPPAEIRAPWLASYGALRAVFLGAHDPHRDMEPPGWGAVRYTVTMERYPPGPEGPRFFAYCREGE